MNAPEPQTWAWGDEEPEPTPGWEFETRWEFGGSEYTRVYTRPVIRYSEPVLVRPARVSHPVMRSTPYDKGGSLTRCACCGETDQHAAQCLINQEIQ